MRKSVFQNVALPQVNSIGSNSRGSRDYIVQKYLDQIPRNRGFGLTLTLRNYISINFVNQFLLYNERVVSDNFQSTL